MVPAGATEGIHVMNRIRVGRLGAGLAAWLILFGCTTSGGTVGDRLAPDQTLRFPLIEDVGSLDPADIASASDYALARNVFGGLLRFDDKLQIVPDIAQALPEVSADGLTYTFHLRGNVQFSNGDPVRAADFVFSWNRAAARQGPYADAFLPVKGYKEMVDARARNQPPPALAGVTAKDDTTLIVTLTQPAGWWVSALAFGATSWVVDERVIKSRGDDWWRTPEGLAGTGPFKLARRVPGQLLEFVPVDPWWGGSTGALKRVRIEVQPDQAAWITGYEQGRYDVVGYAGMEAAPAELLRYRSDPKLSQQLDIQDSPSSTWLGFNLVNGPFRGAEGKPGRLAFSQAIDRKAVVDAACARGATCQAATGYALPKGVRGYVDGDPGVRFDGAAARAAYATWDPDGSKVRGLTYSYSASAQNQLLAENLRSQWSRNLGVTVALEPVDRSAFFAARLKRSYTLFENSWLAAYDDPQNWFDNLFTCHAPANASGYCSPQLDAAVARADQQPVEAALPDYLQAEKTLAEDVASPALFYGSRTYLIQPYVKGAGGNTFTDYYWIDTRILAH